MNIKTLTLYADKYYKDNKNDIFNQLSSIMYIAEGLQEEGNNSKKYTEFVGNLSHTTYTGQRFLEKTVQWYGRRNILQADMYFRMETVIVREDDEYVKFIDYLYYIAIKYFCENEYGLYNVSGNIASLFDDEAGMQVTKHMNQSYEIQKIKRRKSRMIDFYNLHYEYENDIITQIENMIRHMNDEKLNGFVNKQGWNNEIMAFCLVCAEDIKKRITSQAGDELKAKMDDFIYGDFLLQKDYLDRAINNLSKVG